MSGIATGAPFHLEATVRVLQRRPTNLVERWEHDRYIRVIATRTGPALVAVENRGTIDAPNLRYTIRRGSTSRATRTDIEHTLRRTLGLELDPHPLHRQAAAERTLRAAAAGLRGMRPPRFANLFEAFANVIPFQQLSLDAGITIVNRLVERFGTDIDDDGTRRHAFPTAAAIADARVDALRRCGLSSHKAHALQHCARLIASGALAEPPLAAAPTDEALAVLTELPGIGPWSASLVLLRGLGRLDVFPPGDVGANARLGALMRLRGASSLERIVERWGPLRGYLYFCAIGSALLERGLIRPAPPA